MSVAALVELDGLCKTFHTRHFFKFDEDLQRRRVYLKRLAHAAVNISFSITPGQIFGLLGPNGAGKTTIVKTISGLVKPDSGRVLVAGMDVERRRRAVLRRVGVVLEGTRTTMWPLTPLENLTYYGNLKNVSGRVLRARSHMLLDFIGLKEKKHVQVRLLSRGQKQKLAICIALIADPEVLLLDEPTTGLDVQSSRTIKDRMIEITRQQGKAVLVTTHDMHVAQELCDTIGIINEGRLVACKNTEELLEVFSDQIFVFKLDRLPELGAWNGLRGVLETTAELASDGPQLIAKLAGDYSLRSEGLYGLVERLRQDGLLLRSVQQRQQNLESVFLQLTSEKPERTR